MNNNGTATLKVNKHYTFDNLKQNYIFKTEKKFGTDLTFSKFLIDIIINLYSSSSGNRTSNEISLELGLPVTHIQHILKVLKITHDSVPFSEETIESSPEETLIQNVLDSKRSRILQEIQKRESNNIAKDAANWRKFKILELDPFENILSKWTPPKYIPTKSVPNSSQNKNTLLVGLSDWHYGLVAHERYLYAHKEWNIKETQDAVTLYASKIANDVKQNKYKEVKLLLLGDMSHTLTGYTDKGTRLDAHPIGEEQLDVAFDSLVAFVKQVLTVTNNVSVVACCGNHSALGDYILAKMLNLYFKDDSRLNFIVTNKRHITFEIGNSVFLMEHGYSSVTKDRLPQQLKARENYINNLFMINENIDSAKRRYYLSADQHHSESYELTGVEGFMFPTLVGGCRYSDNAGYHSRARQTALVVDDAEGVTVTKYFYFD